MTEEVYKVCMWIPVFANKQREEAKMYIEENGWMLELIFDLSSQALIRMVNQLFHTAYSDKEKIWKEWQRENSIGLKVGETNRYEFQVRRLDGCTQIYAVDRGSVFAWGRSV